MKSLGNISAGLHLVSDAVRRQVDRHGEVALFIGETGELESAIHYEPDYQHVLQARSRYLVGVYRSEVVPGTAEDRTSCIPALVREDLAHWMGFIRVPPRAMARIERREAA